VFVCVAVCAVSDNTVCTQTATQETVVVVGTYRSDDVCICLCVGIHPVGV
jgi:hypothetical protein